MPAAARSGSTSAAGDVRDSLDGRVPCPQCGGLIHPIAGKCKHCKTDLTSYRAARPAANAPLPALGQPTVGQPTMLGNGHPPHAPIAHAVPLPLAAQTVLPQRPSGRAHTASPGSAWRSWPVLVIVVATLAIVAAVVLMAWPPSRGRDGKRALQPPPAPERMDTQTPPVTPKVTPKIDAPQPHAVAPAPRDPWAPPAPQADPPADPGAQADPPKADDDDPQALIDPFTSPSPRTRGHRARAAFGGMVELAMTQRICRKLVQCGTSDAMLKTTCEAIANLPSPPPTRCPAAERCLRHIDAMDCSSQPDALQLGMLLLQFPDCAEAERC
jgi:hypothetical protein